MSAASPLGPDYSAPLYKFTALDTVGPCSECRRSILRGHDAVKQGDRNAHEICYRRAARGRYW